MPLGDLIRQERDKRGWSRGELALRARVSESLIVKMEEGTRGTRVDTLIRVTDALEMPPEAVFAAIRGEVPLDDQPTIPAQIGDILRRLEALESQVSPEDGEDSRGTAQKKNCAILPVGVSTLSALVTPRSFTRL